MAERAGEPGRHYSGVIIQRIGKRAVISVVPPVEPVDEARMRTTVDSAWGANREVLTDATNVGDTTRFIINSPFPSQIVSVLEMADKVVDHLNDAYEART